MGLIDFLNRRKQAQAVVAPVQAAPAPLTQTQGIGATQAQQQVQQVQQQPQQGQQAPQQAPPLKTMQPQSLAQAPTTPLPTTYPTTTTSNQAPTPPAGLHMSQSDYDDAKKQGYTDEQLNKLYADYDPADATPFFANLYKKTAAKNKQYSDKQLKSRRNLAGLADSISLLTRGLAASKGANVSPQNGTAMGNEDAKQERLRQLYEQQQQQYEQGLYAATVSDMQAGRTQQAAKKMDLLNKLKEIKATRLNTANMSYKQQQDDYNNKLKANELAIKQYTAQTSAKTAQDNANTSRLKLLSDLKKANKEDNIQVVADMGRVVNISKSTLTSPAFVGRAYQTLINTLPEDEQPKGTPVKDNMGIITGYKDISQKDMQAFVFKHINDPIVYNEVEDAARIEQGKPPLIRTTPAQQKIIKTVAEAKGMTDKEQLDTLIQQLYATGMPTDSIKYVIQNAMPGAVDSLTNNKIKK